MKNTLLLLFIWSLSLVLVKEQTYAKDLSYYLKLLNDHPQVLAVSEQYKALSLQAEGALGLPDPTVFVGVDNVPVSDPTFDQYLPSSKTLGFSQSIPNSGGRKANREIFSVSANSVTIEVEYMKSRLLSLFFSRMADYKKIKEQVSYEKKKKDIITQLQNYYEGQLVSGQPVYQKTFLTEIEQAEVEQRLNSLAAERKSVEAELLQLLGEIPVIEEMQITEKEWSGKVDDLYPVQLASRNIEVQQAKIELADSRFSPDYGLVGTYKIREEGENNSFDGDDWFSLQFRMTIPLWASKSQQPKLEAARSSKKSAEHRYREHVRKWQMETTRLQSEKQASFLNIEVLQKKDNALTKKIEAMERTYSAGQTSLEPVMQAELARLTLLSQIASERSRYIKLAQELSAHIIAK